MINIYSSPKAYLERLESLEDDSGQVEPVVREILSRVKKEGDVAVREYSQKFDGVAPDPFLVPEQELAQAVAYLDAFVSASFMRSSSRRIPSTRRMPPGGCILSTNFIRKQSLLQSPR